MTSNPKPHQRELSAETIELSEVALQNAERFSDVSSASLIPWLQKVIAELAPETSTFGVRLVTDAEMRQFNVEFRATDAATDVLSFPGDLTLSDRHLGDVLIAVPWARRQAEKSGVSLLTEVKTLLLHGLLHCLGHDHERDDGEMEDLEDRLRQRWIDDVD